MSSLINTAEMPGDKMDPDAIDAGAKTLSTAGTGVSKQGATVLTSWQKISTVYEAPEQQTLYTAMDPAKKAAETFGSHMGTASSALTTFAAEVRLIKAAVAQIRLDAADFTEGIKDGKVEVRKFGVHGVTYKDSVDWDSDQATVNANNALIHRTNDQQEKLWAAERTCANAINAIFGGVQWQAVSEKNPTGYGYDDLPDNVEGLPWGSAVERKESCGESAFKGVVVDGAWNGLVQGVVTLVTGVSWTGPKGLTWDAGDWGNAWVGLAKFGVGLSVISNPTQWPSLLASGPEAAFKRDSVMTVANFVTGLVAIDLYAKDPTHKWKENWSRALGESLFNIVTLPIGVLKIGKLGQLGRLGRAAEVAGDVAKWADPLYLASRAIKGIKTISVDGLSRLGRVGDLDAALHITGDVKVDVPTVKTPDVDTPTTARDNGAPDTDAPGPRDPSTRSDPSNQPDRPNQPDTSNQPDTTPAARPDAPHVDTPNKPDPEGSTDPRTGPGTETGDPATPTVTAEPPVQLPKGLAHQPFETPIEAHGPGTHRVDADHPVADFGTTNRNELGSIGEKLTERDLTDRGMKVVAREPWIRYVDQSGANRYFKPDFLAYDPATNKLVMVESKMGSGAKFTPGQLEGYPYHTQPGVQPKGYTPNTARELQLALEDAGVPRSASVDRIEVYRWNTEITPSADLRRRAGVP